MTKKATILLVDDRPANLIALDGLLGDDERIVMTARSGREALEILSEEKIDLILLDVQMPDMDGFELAQELKGRSDTAEIPIIFASAEKLDHASRLKGLQEGAVDYLLKPLDPDLTKAKVNVLLEVQRQKKLLLEKNALLEKSALLISNSADIIGIVDVSKMMIEQMNPAFTTLLGYEAGSISSRSFLSLFEETDAEKLKGLASSENERISFEAKTLSADGSFKWLDWNVVARGGKWFVNARDITEIKQLNATLERNIIQLEAANRELESFSYSVSHDLRAPLRAIHGNAKAMEEDCLDSLNDEAKTYLKKITDNAIRMDRLINDLLAFSRIGKKEVRKSEVDMGDLVRNVFSEISQSHSHKAKVEIQEMPIAYGDRSMMSVVWTNLISNAIKYSSKKDQPEIKVGGRQLNGEVEYFISDNGTGFDMAYANKLFGTFQRLHDASEFEGVGIGLAICQRIVLKHGGTIRAEAAPGEGATFYFTLPVR